MKELLKFLARSLRDIFKIYSSGPAAPYIKYRRGTKIICPHCVKHIATSRADIWSDSMVSSVMWDGVEAHNRMACPECFTSYVKLDHNKIVLHTQYGWRAVT